MGGVHVMGYTYVYVSMEYTPYYIRIRCNACSYPVGYTFPDQYKAVNTRIKLNKKVL